MIEILLATNSDMLNKTIGDLTSPLLNIFPIFIFMIVVVSLLAVVVGWGTSDTIDRYPTDEEEPEDIKEVEKDARAILMKRYVSGEISDEEYTNKMSRL